MNMDYLRTTEFEQEEVEIEIIDDAQTISLAADTADPFDKLYLSSNSLGKNVKRKVTRELRKADDEDDPKSKSITSESITSYDMFRLVPPPYNLDYLAKLLEINPAHNAAVNAKAVNIAGLGYDIVESPETQLTIERLQGKKTELEKLTLQIKKKKIQLSQALEEWNDDDEFNEILVEVWTDVEAMGNGYLEIGRNRNGKIGYIGHIPGNTIRVRGDRDGFIQVTGNKYVYFRNYGDETTENPLGNDENPNELMHFKKYSPKSTYYGVPPIVAALYAINGDYFAKAYNLDFFENKAVPRYAFITKGVRLSGEAELKLINYFKNDLKGKHHGTLYIPLPASMNQNVDAKFEAIENRPQEQSFIDYIKDSRLEILVTHRVPPSKVGIYDNTNLAISRDADKTFKEQVIKPEQRRLEKKINKLFKELADGKFLIKLGEADIIDADVRSRMHDRYLRTRVEKPNDVRKEIGLPSVPEGEEFLPVPGTLTAGNTPAPPGQAQGNRARSSTVGEKPQSDGGPQRAERGAEQARGAQPRTS